MSTRTDARLDRSLNTVPPRDLADDQAELIGALTIALERQEASTKALEWQLTLARLPRGPQSPDEALSHIAGTIRAYLDVIAKSAPNRPLISLACDALERTASLAESAAEFLAKEMPV